MEVMKILMFCLILTMQLTWLLSTIPDVQWCYMSGGKKKKEKQRKSTLDYILVVLIYCTTATIIER